MLREYRWSGHTVGCWLRRNPLVCGIARGFLFCVLGEVPPVSPYYEGVRCEARVCRPVAGVPGATQHLHHIAGELCSNDTVPRAALGFVVGCPFRGGEARVPCGDRPGVLIAALFEIKHYTPPCLAPFRACRGLPAERGAYSPFGADTPNLGVSRLRLLAGRGGCAGFCG